MDRSQSCNKSWPVIVAKKKKKKKEKKKLAKIIPSCKSERDMYCLHYARFLFLVLYVYYSSRLIDRLTVGSPICLCQSLPGFRSVCLRQSALVDWIDWIGYAIWTREIIFLTSCVFSYTKSPLCKCFCYKRKEFAPLFEQTHFQKRTKYLQKNYLPWTCISSPFIRFQLLPIANVCKVGSSALFQLRKITLDFFGWATTLFTPTFDTKTKFVIMTIWLSRNLRFRGNN